MSVPLRILIVEDEWLIAQDHAERRSPTELTSTDIMNPKLGAVFVTQRRQFPIAF